MTRAGIASCGTLSLLETCCWVVVSLGLDSGFTATVQPANAEIWVSFALLWVL